ncbi:hypothetical protein HNR42_001014 [Deinobacterium chartae]|uniref:Uncharacterized protein n=1 Tax=Deinobacterium chartae TaxID=521158 RepID=A0A841HW27_9DEIO|nr:hypothetical protein [Deinobacterium chartae]MBB6097597.1 hypothetical protein [Deinobacterium chartae]
MQETLRGRVLQLVPVSIHGLVFFNVALKLEGGERRLLRLPQEQLPPGVSVGDRLELELLLGNVMEARRLG